MLVQKKSYTIISKYMKYKCIGKYLSAESLLTCELTGKYLNTAHVILLWNNSIFPLRCWFKMKIYETDACFDDVLFICAQSILFSVFDSVVVFLWKYAVLKLIQFCLEHFLYIDYIYCKTEVSNYRLFPANSLTSTTNSCNNITILLKMPLSTY